MSNNSKYYLNPKVELRNSKIEGKGLFAREKINKGEIIHITEGNILPLNLYKKLSPYVQNLCPEIYNNQFLCPKDPNNPTADFYINHSCNPNCGPIADWYTLVAMKDINKDEEITYDYAMTDSDDADPGWSMSCHCGKKSCRKLITGNDWKIKKLQRKYKGFFQKNIQEKINSVTPETVGAS